ncbi:MAG TPA: hypothetical protein VNT27_05060 [Propionibacteriaceae bacterium]|nr:hypothetical protein [Propionibacteriaceae bacterium]
MNDADSSQQSEAVPSHKELPLPDYDHLPLASLAQRIRSLDTDGLSMLLSYERSHGNRLPVVSTLEARLAQLDAGASPTAGSPDGFVPEKSPGPPAPRSIDQTTDAPKINPPSHGDPTNPAQPR